MITYVTRTIKAISYRSARRAIIVMLGRRGYYQNQKRKNATGGRTKYYGQTMEKLGT